MRESLEILALPAVSKLVALLLGLVVGSFANVLIHRLPLHQSIVSPPSRCPKCGARIRPWDNVPLVSYVLLLGRCRECRAPVSPRYPAVELANGLLYVAVIAAWGPTLRSAVAMALGTGLIVLSVIDLEHQILPDVITLPGIVAGLAATRLPGWPVSFWGGLLSATGGYLAFLAVAAVYRRARGIDGLGQGDWKMAAMLGAFLGWKGLLLCVFMACVTATLVGVVLMARGRNARHALPLGTFLGASALVVLFVGDRILHWYESLYRC